MMWLAKALERPPCRTGSSPLNDAWEGAGAPAVPNRVFTPNDAWGRRWSARRAEPGLHP